MEQRLANTWRMTVNEKSFVEVALASDLRVDGRRPFDYRRLTIEFGSGNGSSRVLLGQTYVMGCVTAQLVQPYRDRPNEGTFSIFTEFSPMADPSFEAGRPGESAVELGRVIDRGLRESKAVDMESLCVVSGKSVWAIRVDLHILDNGGNLIDAANIAALAALMVFRRPECTLGGENNQDVIVHDPEVREPLPLIIHHLPIAITFAFFGEGNVMVIDPSYKEEAVMGGRMTATLNANGDICAVQKAGGEGVMSSVVMQCLRIASVKASDITSKIKNAVDAYNNEMALRKVKRHQSLVGHEVCVSTKTSQVENLKKHAQALEDEPERSCNQVDDMAIDTSTSLKSKSRGNLSDAFVGGPSKWNPYPTGNSSRSPQNSQKLPGPLTLDGEKAGSKGSPVEAIYEQTESLSNSANAVPTMTQQNEASKSLKDAVKPKGKKGRN